MLQTHSDIEDFESNFDNVYNFGEESLTLRRNDRMEAAKKRVQAESYHAQTFQAAFNNMEENIEAVELLVHPSCVDFER